jgi:imidazolonepropionase-like amidohydrolase
VTRRALLTLPGATTLLRGFAPPPVAVTGVTVIDGNGGVRQEQTVIIRGERIAAVAAANAMAPPVDARVIAGRGRVLMPGLWDMHVHLSIAKASALPVLLANGVTGVRDMGGLLHELDRWRTQIDDSVIPGPRIFRAGPILNSKAFNAMQIPLENASEARGAVRALQKAGADFIKVHAAISRETYFGVVGECKALGIRFAGHIPRVIDPAEASNSGQASVEHLYTLFDGTLASGKDPDRLSDFIAKFRIEGASALFERFAKNGTALTPTLAIEYASLRLQDQPAAELDKYSSRHARRMTHDMQVKYRELYTSAYVARQTRQLNETLPLIPLLQQAGVQLLTGTDMGSSLVAPGFSLHDELANLVQAGLSPMAAIQAGTRNATRWLRRDDLGTIEPGKLADLVLLNANPLDNIRNTAKIESVIFGGKVLDRPALDALLTAAARAAQTEED